MCRVLGAAYNRAYMRKHREEKRRTSAHEAHTGQEAAQEAILESNGKTFAQIKAERTKG